MSHRLTLNTSDIAGCAEPLKNKMLLKEFILHLEVTKDEVLEDFLKTYVKEIQMFILDEQMIGRNEVLPLFSEIEATIYTPGQVLEVIYEPRSLWERIKNRGRKIMANFPRALLSLLTTVLGLVLRLMGFETSAKSVVMRFLPTKSILHWLISFVGMFFPMLSPFLTLGSRYFLG